MTHPLLAAAVLAGACAPAAAQISYVSQNRFVDSGCQFSSQSFSASDFSPFNQTAHPAGGIFVGYQNSTLGPGAISASGGTGPAQGSMCSGPYAHSSFSTTFTLAQACTYTFTFQAFTPGGPIACQPPISLSGPGVSIVHDPQTMTGQQNVSGTLQPGQYTLTASSTAGPGSLAGCAYSVNLSVTPVPASPFTIDWWTIDGGGDRVSGGGLVIDSTIGQCDATGRPGLSGGALALAGGFWAVRPPCPADFNASGDVTVQDIYDFLSAWNAEVGQPTGAADFNALGGVSVQDIYDFLAAWNASVAGGCP